VIFHDFDAFWQKHHTLGGLVSFIVPMWKPAVLLAIAAYPLANLIGPEHSDAYAMVVIGAVLVIALRVAIRWEMVEHERREVKDRERAEIQLKVTGESFDYDARRWVEWREKMEEEHRTFKTAISEVAGDADDALERIDRIENIEIIHHHLPVLKKSKGPWP